MTEITEIGEVIWESNANRAIIDIEQKTEIQTIKDLIKCFDTKEAGKKSSKFSNTFDKIEICVRTWVDKKKLIIEAINFIDERENNEENNDENNENNEENNENNEGLNDLHEEDLIGYVIFSINSRMPKKCQDCRE